MRGPRVRHDNKKGMAAADGLSGRSDPSSTQANSIPPRPDGRYLDRVANDGSWPGVRVPTRCQKAVAEYNGVVLPALRGIGRDIQRS